jgi:hypothetical protein
MGYLLNTTRACVMGFFQEGAHNEETTMWGQNAAGNSVFGIGNLEYPKQPPRKLGRPATGKRSNPEYAQHSMWLPGSLYGHVLKGLVTPDGKRHEFSALVESLLRQRPDPLTALPQ